MKRITLPVLLFSFCVAILPFCAYSDIRDPFDPFSIPDNTNELENDKDKSAAELAAEASEFFKDERPLDARTKLLRALQKDPEYYNAHSLLAGYYMVHVGHFRLALKYVRQAIDLFEKKYGKPPYANYLTRLEHGHLLYLLSQVRLELGDYQGSLDVLDEYSSLGYYDDWYPGTRAWVLMKLGRLDEAIKVARLGIMSNAEPGRTMNILGILLSMTGNPTGAIEVFKQTVAWETTMGKVGQPATPLNNMGEVYRERFDEAKAESSWLRSTSMPDGCEHVLSAVNLVLLHLDDLKLEAAKRALDNFEACFAQYPLKNGEEHRALVALMRGRIAMKSGNMEQSLKLLDTASESRQWFGKIGTSEEDLKTGVLSTLGQAEKQMANILALKLHDSWLSWAKDQAEIQVLRIKSFWHSRRARQILIEDLKSIEDIKVRNTDSMIEYAVFGEALGDIPPEVLRARINKQLESDKRPEADIYYKVWLAENLLENNKKAEGLELLNEVITRARPQTDSALKLKAMLLKLSLIPEDSEQYNRLSQEIFFISSPALRNYGFKLPVTFRGDNSELKNLIGSGPFLLSQSGTTQCSIESNRKKDDYEVRFNCLGGSTGPFEAKGKTAKEAINNLSNKVFSQDLS